MVSTRQYSDSRMYVTENHILLFSARRCVDHRTLHRLRHPLRRLLRRLPGHQERGETAKGLLSAYCASSKGPNKLTLTLTVAHSQSS